MQLSRARSSQGFTLIELLITVAVIGIMAAMMIPNLLTALDKGKQVSTAGLLKSFGQSIEIYKIDNGMNPDVATVFELLPVLNPYSESLRPLDEWRYAVGYAHDVDEYSMESFGKHGIDGINITPQTRYIFSLDTVYSGGQFTASVD